MCRWRLPHVLLQRDPNHAGTHCIYALHAGKFLKLRTANRWVKNIIGWGTPSLRNTPLFLTCILYIISEFLNLFDFWHGQFEI